MEQSRNRTQKVLDFLSMISLVGAATTFVANSYANSMVQERNVESPVALQTNGGLDGLVVEKFDSKRGSGDIKVYDVSRDRISELLFSATTTSPLCYLGFADLDGGKGLLDIAYAVTDSNGKFRGFEVLNSGDGYGKPKLVYSFSSKPGDVGLFFATNYELGGLVFTE